MHGRVPNLTYVVQDLLEDLKPSPSAAVVTPPVGITPLRCHRLPLQAHPRYLARRRRGSSGILSVRSYSGLVHPRLVAGCAVAAHHTHSRRAKRAPRASGRLPASRRAGPAQRPLGLSKPRRRATATGPCCRPASSMSLGRELGFGPPATLKYGIPFSFSRLFQIYFKLPKFVVNLYIVQKS
jgi:hypothetical protein